MKIDLKMFWKTRKKWILIGAAAVTAVAVGCGIWYGAGHSSRDPVYVFPFQYVGMTEYWGDSQESYGPVTTDKIQTVFLSDTQTVTEILVQPGDAVKKGDLLMSFDTTLSDLQLERKRLDVEKKKLELEDAKEYLREINSMKPMVIPQPSEDSDEESDLGRLVNGAYEFSTNTDYDGSTPEKALICWLHSDTGIESSILAAAHQVAVDYQTINAPEPTEPTDPTGESTEPTDPTGESTKPTDPTGESTEPTDPTGESTEPTDPSGSGVGQEPSSASALEKPPVNVEQFYMVFRVTAENKALGEKQVWQGVLVTKTAGGFAFRFADAVIPDHMMRQFGSEDTDTNAPQIDFGSGYTASQIAQMRSDQQKKIKDLEFAIKMAEAEYKIMQTEVDDGNVYAQIDGEVVSVLTEEEAKQTMQPVLKVSGGGGFYVEGFVSELEKDKLKLGQEVTVNDWNTGMTYTGTIESMGDFPSRDGYYNGMGNPNASYYPFRVFVDESADLQAGSYVSVMYSAAESQNGIYLENPYLRTEKGKSYVMVMGEGGRLEQRFVTTGKSLWGTYTEILKGLTAEDLIAFPYGKNVKPGAAAVEGDLSDLYGG